MVKSPGLTLLPQLPLKVIQSLTASAANLPCASLESLTQEPEPLQKCSVLSASLTANQDQERNLEKSKFGGFSVEVLQV